MKMGKKYILMGAANFMRTCSANRHMAKLIDEKGPWFEVVDMQTRGVHQKNHVTGVKFSDGSIYTDKMDGSNYFEIFEDEFYHFREFQHPPKVDECSTNEATGVVSMTIEVNHKNFEAMIDLIKKNFAK